jgi:hypothetical protein
VHLDHLRWLGGPNLYVSRPVAIARLELEELTGRETTDFAGFAERLVPLRSRPLWLPRLPCRRLRLRLARP